MAERVADRRSRRTKRLLHGALFELIVERGYEAITVQDILDRADVGRSTFYDHFSGKDELLRHGFERLAEELGGISDDASRADPFAFAIVLFRHAVAHEAIYRSIVGGRGGVVARREFQRVLDQYVAWSLKAAGGDASGRAVAALSGAFLGLVEHWLAGRRGSTAEELDSVFRRLATALT